MSRPSDENLEAWYSFSLDYWVSQQLSLDPGQLKQIFPDKDSALQSIADIAGFEAGFIYKMRRKGELSASLLVELTNKVRGLSCEAPIWQALLQVLSQPIPKSLETYLIELGLIEGLVYSASSHSGLLNHLPNNLRKNRGILELIYKDENWSLEAFKEILEQYFDVTAFMLSPLKGRFRQGIVDAKIIEAYLSSNPTSISNLVSKNLKESLETLQARNTQLSELIKHVENFGFTRLDTEQLALMKGAMKLSPIRDLVEWAMPSSPAKEVALMQLVYTLPFNQHLVTIHEHRQRLRLATLSKSIMEVNLLVVMAVNQIHELHEKSLAGNKEPDTNEKLTRHTTVLSKVIANPSCSLELLRGLAVVDSAHDTLGLVEVYESSTDFSWQTSWIRRLAEVALQDRLLTLAANPKTLPEQLKELARTRNTYQATYIRRAAKRQLKLLGSNRPAD